LDKTVILRLSRKKKPIMKRSKHKMKQVDRFAYLGSTGEKNCKIQNEINARIRKVSQLYHLINSMLWNKDKDTVDLGEIGWWGVDWIHLAQNRFS
jgi:hypothetical protein